MVAAGYLDNSWQIDESTAYIETRRDHMYREVMGGSVKTHAGS